MRVPERPAEGPQVLMGALCSCDCDDPGLYHVGGGDLICACLIDGVSASASASGHGVDENVNGGGDFDDYDDRVST